MIIPQQTPQHAVIVLSIIVNEVMGLYWLEPVASRHKDVEHWYAYRDAEERRGLIYVQTKLFFEYGTWVECTAHIKQVYLYDLYEQIYLSV